MTLLFSDSVSLSPTDELDLFRRLASALRTAIYDKKVERDATVVYYYDADVVTAMILGFQQFKYATKAPRQQRSQRTLFVRSLLSFGYMGTLCILRPHAFELDDVLQRKPAFRSDQGRDDFRQELRTFLENWNVGDHFDRLRRVIVETPKTQRVDRFLQELQKIGPEAFVPIELAHGNWQQRMVRFGRKGILQFDDQGDNIHQILGDPALEQFRALITHERERDHPEGSKRLSLSNFRDAMALTTLYRLIGKREKDPTVPLVRFYTETDVLQSAWSNSETMRNMLSYKPISACLSWENCPDFIGRTADYFVVRALFEELRFPSVKLRQSAGRPAVTLSALEEVAHELATLPIESDDLRQLLSNSQKLNGQTVGEYLRLFGSLSFIRSIWVRYKPPVVLKRYIHGFEEVWAFAQDGPSAVEIRRRVSDELGEVQKQLRSQVEDLRSWFSTLAVIQNSSRRFLMGRDEYLTPPDPMLELGLVRWGIQLSSEAKSRFRALVMPLIAKDENEWGEGCIDLTSAIRDVGNDEEECAVICSILWWLNNFQTLTQVLDLLEVNLRGQLPVWSHVMRAAAHIQNSSLEFEAKIELVEELRTRLRALTPKRRRPYLIGVGYVFFHVWHSEMKQERRGQISELERRQELLQGWIEESFKLGEEACKGLEKGGLLWAFAVNHCAYVGSMANIQPTKTATYLAQLGSFEDNAELWNYRFVDTLAYSFYLDAKRLWQTHDNLSRESDLEILRHKVWVSLRKAFDVHERARQHFGDREIPAHQNDLNQLARQSDYPYPIGDLHIHQRIGHESVPDRV